MKNLTSIRGVQTQLPVCLIVTEFPELEGLIRAALSPCFRFSETDAPSLTVTDHGSHITLSLPDKNTYEALERPFSADVLLDCAVRLTEHTSLRHFSEDPAHLSAVFSDRSVRLTETEFKLYSAIPKNGDFITAKALSEAVWDRFDRNLCTVYVSYLRQKLDSAFGYGTLITVRGKGYALRRPDTENE